MLAIDSFWSVIFHRFDVKGWINLGRSRKMEDIISTISTVLSSGFSCDLQSDCLLGRADMIWSSVRSQFLDIELG
jgi:hypothetical protein